MGMITGMVRDLWAPSLLFPDSVSGLRASLIWKAGRWSPLRMLSLAPSPSHLFQLLCVSSDSVQTEVSRAGGRPPGRPGTHWVSALSAGGGACLLRRPQLAFCPRWGQWEEVQGRQGLARLNTKTPSLKHSWDTLQLTRLLSFSRSAELLGPTDCSPPGSSVQGILQTRILEQVAISYSRGSSDPGTELASPALAGGFFTTGPSGKPS